MLHSGDGCIFFQGIGKLRTFLPTTTSTNFSLLQQNKYQLAFFKRTYKEYFIKHAASILVFTKTSL